MPRARYEAPSRADSQHAVTYPPKDIQFLHPGYAGSGHQLLFFLPAADANGSLHHETARTACAIIAGNRFEGFLSEDQAGQKPVTDDPEAGLSLDQYYFQVPMGGGLDSEYAIVPSFQEWQLLSNPSLPPYWAQCVIPRESHDISRAATPQAKVLLRDSTCRMTQHTMATEAAHLIPTAQAQWFRDRAMESIADFDNSYNYIWLRRDVHLIFDAKHCTILPRRFGGSHVLVAHGFGRNCPKEVVELYHDVQLQPLSGIKMEFLLTRLAWTIFDSIKLFLQRNLRRWIRVRSPNGTWQDMEWSAEQCYRYVESARSRSASPTKRARSNGQPLEEEFGTRKRSFSSISDCLSEAKAELDPDFECNERSRKRKRSDSLSTSDVTISVSSSWRSATNFTDQDPDEAGCLKHRGAQDGVKASAEAEDLKTLDAR